MDSVLPPVRSNNTQFASSKSVLPSVMLSVGRFIELHRKQAARLNCERIFSAMSGIPPIRRTQILGLCWCTLLVLFQSVLRRRVDIEFCWKRIFPHKAIARWAMKRVTRWAPYDRCQSLWHTGGPICHDNTKARTQSTAIFPFPFPDRSLDVFPSDDCQVATSRAKRFF